MTTGTISHPLAKAGERAGFPLDELIALQTIGDEIDQRTAALALENDPGAGLLERDRIIARLGRGTAGIQTSAYGHWYGALIQTLNAHTRRWVPDAGPGVLLNPYLFTIGAA